MSNALAIRLVDRYMNAASPLSIASTGRLGRFLVLSCVMATIVCTAFVTISKVCPPHHITIHDVDVCFEITCAPPEPSFRAVNQLIPLRFEEGQQPAALANEEHKTPVTGIQTALLPSTPQVVVPKKATHAVPEQAPIAISRPVVSSAPRPQPMAAAIMSNPFTGSAASAATPAASSPASGLADGQAGATGIGGTGSGTAQGDPNALAGGDFGAQNLISMKAPAVALGNIGPYKRDLVSRIRQIWHPEDTYEFVTIDLALDHDGKLVDKKIIVSSGNQRTDASLLSALDNAQFAALPEWYRGHELHIKVKLQST
jgi:hypothetical protein